MFDKLLLMMINFKCRRNQQQQQHKEKESIDEKEMHGLSILLRTIDALDYSNSILKRLFFL